MLLSLAIVFLVGLSSASIFKRLHLPRILGMLLTGIVTGPFVLDWLDSSILGISSELRQIALVIILIKAGLSLDISDLKKVGRPAILMSFLPAVFEIVAFALIGPFFLEITRLEATIIGAVLGAVSPAVVVPKMVELIDRRLGTEKGIPQLILAGASLDDVFVIVLFTTFVGMAKGDSINAMSFLNIPVSIILGIVFGAAVGFVISFFFEKSDKKGAYVNETIRLLIVLSVSFLLVTVESVLEGKLAVSGLLAVMSMACVIKIRCKTDTSKILADKFGKLWVAAEVILFVMVGAAVDIRYTVEAGGKAVLMIFIALFFRSIGVLLCMIKTKLNFKERLFCVIAYLPKATVQAAIGAVPLSLGLPCGKIVLSIAVLSIIITAPLGAIGMELTDKHLLTFEEKLN